MTEVFVKKANLPDAAVTFAAVSCRNHDFTEELHRLGIRTADCGKLPSVEGSESFHADMCMLHLGSDEIIVPSGLLNENLSELENEGLRLISADETVTTRRPFLNICLLDKTVLCCRTSENPKIIALLRNRGFHTVYTNQRYVKCSCAVVSKNALITSDPSVYRSCMENDIDALKIREGHILLEGYEYGFIGGTCGLVSGDTLAFSGNISLHPDYENIKSFAMNYGVRLYSLSSQPLYDIGGILPIKQCASR